MAAIEKGIVMNPIVPTTTTEDTPAKQWAIVELFGHTRIAGAISEHVFAGETYTRIDVPEVRCTEVKHVQGRPTASQRVIQAHTKLFASKAIYSIALLDEAATLVAAVNTKHEPVRAWMLSELLNNLSDAERCQMLGARMPTPAPTPEPMPEPATPIVSATEAA